MEKRCSVFTYYEPPADKEKAKADEEATNALLLTWRRAWWAQGFAPIILTLADAKEHSLFTLAEKRGEAMSPEMKMDLRRWLAWGHVGGGALVSERVVPMGRRDDDTLQQLRQCGKFDQLSRYEEFAGRLYSSNKTAIDKVLTWVLDEKAKIDFARVKTVEDAIVNAPDPAELPIIHVEPKPHALADYSPNVIDTLYPSLKLSSLPGLINSHLHSLFLSSHPDGITYLTPFSNRLAPLHTPALQLAQRLANCPISAPEKLRSSCPPNIPSCSPCTKRAAISSRSSWENSTTAFLLGVVPHPFTTIQLANEEIRIASERKEKALKYLRRKQQRDPWVRKVTDEAFTQSHVGSQPRLILMKSAVVQQPAAKLTGIWGTEIGGFGDVEWTLGFEVATLEKLGVKEVPGAGKEGIRRLDEGLKKVKACRGDRVCRAVEDWCLADTEIWRFVEAWRGRGEVEREGWKRGERKVGAGLGLGEA